MFHSFPEVRSDESMFLVATGQFIGEGFDYPGLDTLFLAKPVSWKGIVEQYAGRLHREYPGKKNVYIFDYVDTHIPVFDKMYAKRLRTYKRIGYSLHTSDASEKQSANATFDSDNYRSVFEQDIREATNSVVISSPNAVDITCVSIVFKQVLMPLFQAHEVLGLVPNYISVYLFFPHE